VAGRGLRPVVNPYEITGAMARLRQTANETPNATRPGAESVPTALLLSRSNQFLPAGVGQRVIECSGH
jgi:hypothetical protein